MLNIYFRFENTEGLSKMDNPEKLATWGTQDEENKIKTQHTMYWTPLCTNKYK
jgi:hypothetical protein